MTKIELGKLVAAIRQGDKGAFEQLYAATNEAVYARARTILKTEDDVEDAVQEAYEQALLHLDSLKNPEAVGAWLLQTVAYISMNKLRAARRHDADSLDLLWDATSETVEDLPEAAVERKADQELLARLIAGLPERQRQAMALYYCDGLSTRELARRMHCSESTVRVHLHAARKTLRAQLKKEGYPFLALTAASLRAAMRLLEGQGGRSRAPLGVARQAASAAKGMGMARLGRWAVMLAAVLALGGIGRQYLEHRELPEPQPSMNVELPSPAPTTEPAPTPLPSPTPTPAPTPAPTPEPEQVVQTEARQEAAAESTPTPVPTESPAPTANNGLNILTEENFPDENFRAVLIDQYGRAMPASEAEHVSQLDLSGGAITDYTGLDYFQELSFVTIRLPAGMELAELSGLEQLDKVESLHIIGNMERLDAGALPGLKSLTCSSLGLRELDVSGNPALTALYCEDNELSALDLSGNPMLTTLWCWGNPLHSMDLSGNMALTAVRCDTCGLEQLVLPGNGMLRTLDCTFNCLRTLDLRGQDVLSLSVRMQHGGSVHLRQMDGLYYADLSELVGEENLSRVRSVYRQNDETRTVDYDPVGGLACFGTEEPQGFVYYYDTGNASASIEDGLRTEMPVRVTVAGVDVISLAPEATPEPTPEATPEPTPEATPESTPEVTPEPTPEATPESTPEPTEEEAPPEEESVDAE